MKPFGNRLQPRLRIAHCLIIDTDWKGDCRRFFKSQPIEISGDNAPEEFQRAQKLPKLNRLGVGERKSCPAGHKTQVSPIFASPTGFGLASLKQPVSEEIV